MPVDTTITREVVVACARSWIGTRFHHQGRLKRSAHHRGGVDCLGLLIGVARECGLYSKKGVTLPDLDEVHYSAYPDGRYLRQRLAGALVEIDVQAVCAADVLLISLQDNPQHLAIMSEAGIIHAYAQARGVVEHALDDTWKRMIVAAFRLPVFN